MKRTMLITFLLLFTMAQKGPAADGGEEKNLGKRRAHLEELLPLIEPEHPERGWVTRLDPTWRDWLERTGELPPDFDSLPSIPLLPDPLVIFEGREESPVTTVEKWQEKRRWIKARVQHWITGTFPPRPDNMEAVVLSEEKSAGGVIQRMVELRFGPGHRAKLTLELLIPPGKGPFPVFLSQWSHRGWALVAVRRGYVGCLYAGADSRDDTEGYAEIWYPDYDFTRLMRRAWGAHRAVDYLYTLPFVDRGRIGITGHSRNGKQSIMAAAFDERIAACIPSSGGTGAGDPFRYTSDKFDNETISEITTWFPYWLHPRLRFFIGREHKLPVDQNLFMALIAPRGLMLSSAITEHQGNPWGIEQNYHSLHRVYSFLDAGDKLAIRLRHGRHGTSARDIESYVDFFDYVFGRGTVEPPRDLYYNYTFDRWRRLSGESIDPALFPEKDLGDLLEGPGGEAITSATQWEKKKPGVLERTCWALGDKPAGGFNPGPRELRTGQRDDYLGGVIGRPEPGAKMGRAVIGPYHSFGDYLYGSLYYPTDNDGKPVGKNLPIVIYIHEYAYPTGFARRIEPFLEKIVDRGMAVFVFDMIGFGTRIEEGRLFYERYPHWSKLGRMVADVRGAVDMLQNLDLVDSGRIYAAGYSLGGTVALYSAALDERIRGAASVCGFTPLRLAGKEKGLEGLASYSHLHGLQPRLGFFLGHEKKIPFDFHELLASIAPRPLLVVAPRLDRDACFEDVTLCVGQARQVYRLYGAGGMIKISAPQDYNRFSEQMQKEIVDWLSEVAGR